MYLYDLNIKLNFYLILFSVILFFKFLNFLLKLKIKNFFFLGIILVDIVNISLEVGKIISYD